MTGGASTPPVDAGDIQRAVTALYALTGTELSGYKPNVLRRRLRGRARQTGAPSLTRYLDKLEVGGSVAEHEAQQFLASLSVRVSSFFRDPEVFAALEDRVFPELLEPRPKRLEIWCAGCSWGQEAYSLAIALRRCVQRLSPRTTARVLGTDVDTGAVRHARLGIYTAKMLRGLAEATRNAAFEPTSSGRWRVRAELRAMVHFEHGDVLDHTGQTRSPTKRFDLVSCRNLLIYLDRPVQEKLILALRRALRPGGFLVLGTSETVLGQPWRLLEHISPAQRIYRRPANPATPTNEGSSR